MPAPAISVISQRPATCPAHCRGAGLIAPPLYCPAARVPASLQSTEDVEYMEMEAAFHSSGGIVTADEVASLLQMRTEQPISMLARWIVSHEVLSFQWRSRTLLPLFQFELSTMTLRPPVTKAIGELLSIQTEWETALWFARPNTWLADVAPVNVVDRDPGAVIDAARADGYLIRG